MVKSYAKRLQQQQISWAEEQGLAAYLETRDGKVSWVLKKEHQALNLYDVSWWSLIHGKEHRWARALNSSQCFAVNLFAPFVNDPEMGHQLNSLISPSDYSQKVDEVEVLFEWSPLDIRFLLGEYSGQVTQVDVALVFHGEDTVIGNTLVEVKLSETTFGACGGADLKRNALAEYCSDAHGIVAEPQKRCWLSRDRGRKYWEIMRLAKSSFNLQDKEWVGEACPFKGGLYQVMRNQVLCEALKKDRELKWSNVALCTHPENKVAYELKEKVLSNGDVVSAFESITNPEILVELKPHEIINLATDKWAAWKVWMAQRYKLHGI